MTPDDSFIQRYGSMSVPYADEVIRALRDGKARVLRAPSGPALAKAAELADVYQGRVKQLSSFSTAFAVTLRRDIDALCQKLATRKRETFRTWEIEHDPYFIYSFFEWSSDLSFIGAFKAADNRKLTDADRMTLWGRTYNL